MIGPWDESPGVFCLWYLFGSVLPNLMHQDSRSVIKVVRYGLNIQCFPNEHAVELVEKQIARQQNRRENEREGTEGLEW